MTTPDDREVFDAVFDMEAIQAGAFEGLCDWLQANKNPEEVFEEEEELAGWARRRASDFLGVEEVFSEADLHEWAKDEGYVMEGS